MSSSDPSIGIGLHN